MHTTSPHPHPPPARPHTHRPTHTQALHCAATCLTDTHTHYTDTHTDTHTTHTHTHTLAAHTHSHNTGARSCAHTHTHNFAPRPHTILPRVVPFFFFFFSTVIFSCFNFYLVFVVVMSCSSYLLPEAHKLSECVSIDIFTSKCEEMKRRLNVMKAAYVGLIVHVSADECWNTINLH